MFQPGQRAGLTYEGPVKAQHRADDGPVDALVAACKAAGAPCYGIARNRNPAGWGLWTHRDSAETLADGLRLTGYRVSLSPGYSVGVVILD